VVSINLTGAGSGYINPPSVILSAPVDSAGNLILNSCTAQAVAVLAAGPASVQVTLAGMGGVVCRKLQFLPQGNNLQIFDFHDDLDSPTAAFPNPQSSSIFYYNVKRTR